MAEEKKIFAGGGMDMDTEERFMGNNDYRFANNCRITSSDEENEGVVENVIGNQILNLNLTTLDGTLLTDSKFVVIGSYEDKKFKTFYYFVTEKSGSIISLIPPIHCIISNLSSNINQPGNFQVLYENPQLNFKTNSIITGINMVHGQEVARAGLLYWTDDRNPPRKLNVQKAYWWTRSLSTNPILDPEFSYQEEPNLDAIVSPPMGEPRINSFTYTDANGDVALTSGNNYSMASNDIKNSLWQFKYRYIYRDNFKSSWSPISNSATTSFNDASVDDLTISNFIEVVIDTGVQEVLSIELAVRENEDKGDFYLIAKIDKDDTLQKNILLTSSVGALNTQLISSIVTFDESNNTPLYYIFSNNEPKIPIDLQESIKLFDDVPLLAKAQEVIDGNRLAYGNIVNGYDAVPTDTELEVVYQDITAQHGNITPINYSWKGINGNTCVDSGTFSDDWRKSAEITMKIHVGDVSSMQSGTMINIAIDEVGIAARFMRTSNFLCGYKAANRMGKISLQFNDTVGIGLTNITDLAANMNANCNVLLENIDFDGDGAMNPRWGLSHSTSGMCEPSSPISTFNGTSNGAFSSSGNGIIEFKFMVAHNSELTKTGCNGIEWKVVVGFDGETLWDYDIDSNTAATSSIWPGTLSGSSGPIKYAGYYAPNNTGQFTGGVGNQMTYDQNWVSQNNSNIIAPMATSVTNFRGFKSGTRHSFGLVYYDKDNRSGTVNPCGDIYVPFRNERVSGLEDAAASIHFKINHLPPAWADHYQWVWAPHKRGDFLHITVNTIEYDLSIKARYRTVLPESQDDVGGGGGMTGFQSLIEPAILSTGYIKMDMEELIRHSAKASTDTMMWQWAQGDRVRILDITTVGAGGATIPNCAGMDFEIIGIEEEVISGGAGKLWFILEKAAVGPVILTGVNLIDVRVEIYRPKKIQGDVYYEFGHVNWCSGTRHSVNRLNTEEQLASPATYMDVNNTATASVYHYNQNDNTHPTLPGTNPAEGTLQNGDVYLRERLMITAGSAVGGPLPAGGIILAEDYSFSDFFKSKAWDLGRPNAYLPDFKQTRRDSTIFFSEPIIPNTNINGLGTFYADVSFKEFDKKYNSIQKLFSINDKLLIFQEDKVSASMVSRAVLFDATGEQNVAISNNVLSSSVPYSGDYGISSNPESFANHGFRSYFVDAKRRSVLRLSMDGLTVISEYKMKNFFTDYFEEIISNNRHLGNRTKIYGAWDDKFDEYVVSHLHTSWTEYDPINGFPSKKSIPGFTIGFHEPSKRWNSFYSYNGALATYNNTLHSFNRGNIYKHNALTNPLAAVGTTIYIYNEFHNVKYNSTLEFAFNDFPLSTKVYHSITEDSSDIWEVDSLYTRNNQLTNISRVEFTNGATYSWEDGHGTKENKHNALIRCDLSTPGVALPKIEGNRMRDTSIMCRLSLPVPQSQERNTLFSVGCGYIASTDASVDGN